MKEKSNAKPTIILYLGDSPIAKTFLLMHVDKKSTKMLWDEIQRMFSAYSTQQVAIRHSTLFFKFLESANWDDHVSEFLSWIYRLAGLNQHLTYQNMYLRLFYLLISHSMIVFWHWNYVQHVLAILIRLSPPISHAQEYGNIETNEKNSSGLVIGDWRWKWTLQTNLRCEYEKGH